MAVNSYGETFHFTHCELCGLSFAIRDPSPLPGLCSECFDNEFGCEEGTCPEITELLEDYSEWVCKDCHAAYGGHECRYCCEVFCVYCIGEHESDCDYDDSDLYDEDDD